MYIFYAASDVSSGLLRHMDGLLEVLYRLLPENLPDPETAHRAVMWLAARGYLPLDLDRWAGLVYVFLAPDMPGCMYLWSAVQDETRH